VFERRLRLHQPEDYAQLRASGRVYHHPALLLSLLPNDLPHNRYGFITSKQIGGAVIRNRTRRLLREAVRSFHPRLPTGYDLVLIARQGITGKSLVECQIIVESLLRQASLVN
jgi:ribonuclease P protein component